MTIHLPGFPGQSSTWIGHGIVSALAVALTAILTPGHMEMFTTAIATAIVFRIHEWNDTREHAKAGHGPLQTMDEIGTTIIGDGHADMTGPYTVVVLTGLLWLVEVIG